MQEHYRYATYHNLYFYCSEKYVKQMVEGAAQDGPAKEDLGDLLSQENTLEQESNEYVYTVPFFDQYCEQSKKCLAIVSRAAKEPWGVKCDAVFSRLTWSFPPSSVHDEDTRAALAVLRTHGVVYTREEAPTNSRLSDELNFAFPFLTVQYTRREVGREAVHDICRMTLVTIVQFYATLGISEFPVFGLVVEGSIGYFLLAGVSQSGVSTSHNPSSTHSDQFKRGFNHCYQNTYVVDRNLPTFDISTSVGVTHLLEVIAQMHNSSLKQSEKLEMARRNFLAKKLYQNLEVWPAQTHEAELHHKKEYLSEEVAEREAQLQEESSLRGPESVTVGKPDNSRDPNSEYWRMPAM